ncbi:putative glycoside hydrolase [Vibrio sp. C8]
MSNLNKKLIAIAILPFLLAGCGEEQKMSSEDSTENVFNLFGVKAVDTAYKALILSATDGYASTVVTDAYVFSSDINAGLINNNGTNDTIDVEVLGLLSGSLMLQADNKAADFSNYESGFLEFNIRSKSAVPDDLTVAIDNGWPNRKVFSLNGYVNHTNDWEGISIPIKCMKPGAGMNDFSLDSVVTPFFMESSKAYSFEITDIAYKEKSEFTPIVDANSCS